MRSRDDIFQEWTSALQETMSQAGLEATFSLPDQTQRGGRRSEHADHFKEQLAEMTEVSESTQPLSGSGSGNSGRAPETFDPELPISIVDLGLVEDIAIEGDGMHDIHVMLLPTFIGCPALDMIAKDVETKVADLSMVSSCKVSWIFDPPWSVDRISDSGRLQLQEHGVTVPSCGSMAGGPEKAIPLMTSAIPCPYCGSTRPAWTALMGPHGAVRSISAMPAETSSAYEAGQPVRLRALLMHLS